MALIHAGVAAMTEFGYTGVGIDYILKRTSIPKGSFYHYFGSKEEFGLAVLDEYSRYFLSKINMHLSRPVGTVEERFLSFSLDAAGGMMRHDFRRGCLVGNLAQETGLLPEVYRGRLTEIFDEWERCTAACLEEGKRSGEVPPHLDSRKLAAFFWTGWEGAVARAKLMSSAEPLSLFMAQYLQIVLISGPRRGNELV